MGKRADHSTISLPPTDGCSGLSHPHHQGVYGDGCSHRPAAHSTYHIQARLPRRGDATPTRCNKLQCCLGAPHHITSTMPTFGIFSHRAGVRRIVEPIPMRPLAYHVIPAPEPADDVPMAAGAVLDPTRLLAEPSGSDFPWEVVERVRASSVVGHLERPDIIRAATSKARTNVRSKTPSAVSQHRRSSPACRACQAALCSVCPPKGGGGVGARLPEVPTFSNVTHRTGAQPSVPSLLARSCWSSPLSPSLRSSTSAAAPLLPTPSALRCPCFSESLARRYVPLGLSSQPLPFHHPRKPPSTLPSLSSSLFSSQLLPSICHQNPPVCALEHVYSCQLTLF